MFSCPIYYQSSRETLEIGEGAYHSRGHGLGKSSEVKVISEMKAGGEMFRPDWTAPIFDIILALINRPFAPAFGNYATHKDNSRQQSKRKMFQARLVIMLKKSTYHVTQN